jgi:hypothetical protein
MIRNDLQHIQLDSQSQREPALQEQDALQLQTFTAEGIELKPPIQKKLKTSSILILVLALRQI